MQKTPYYGLNLPERNDQYNIDHFNENSAEIDTLLKGNAVNIAKNAVDIAGNAANIAKNAAGIAENADAITSHVANDQNPHSVTKAQVGLGNVPNVTTNDQTPTFAEAASLENINSGEKLSVILGKVKKALSAVIASAANTCPFPVGAIYPQYPQQKAPGELWAGTTWVVLDYGGAFFRAQGGNATDFNRRVTVTAVSGANITCSAGHNITVGSVVRSETLNQARLVTAVSGNVITVAGAFSGGLSELYVGQEDALQSHAHGHDAIGARKDSSSFQGTAITFGSGGWGLDSRLSGRSAVETRAMNMTFKVWRRSK